MRGDEQILVLTVGSLFSGIGGLDLGLERTGMEIIWQCENDPYCQKVLQKRWPEIELYGNIKEVDWNDVERPDIICGGFPCQDISKGGSRKGLSGKRSSLWWEMFKAVCHFRPRYVIVENSSGIVDRGLIDIIGHLTQAGYDTEWTTIRASQFGTLHTRARTYIVAYPMRKRPLDNESFIFPDKGRDQEIPHITSGFGRETKNRVCRGDDGVPDWMDRYKSLGNAMIPHIACFIGTRIQEHYKKNKL